MYYLIVFSFILSLAYTKSAQQVIRLAPDVNSRLQPIITQCISETGSDPSIVLELNSMKISNEEQFKKFIYCDFTKSDLTTAEGHWKIEKVLQFYPKTVEIAPLQKAMESCNKENGQDPADTTFKIFKCFIKRTPVIISF
uniref:Odorant-binding protein 16 n=1 Tax=Streltzoviella insularis TaxID=1206366 RepID=A0A7D5UMK3_9NEOP|nr:odorant-binding protein 16 [Streltzoviella insularis]